MDKLPMGLLEEFSNIQQKEFLKDILKIFPFHSGTHSGDFLLEKLQKTFPQEIRKELQKKTIDENFSGFLKDFSEKFLLE